MILMTPPPQLSEGLHPPLKNTQNAACICFAEILRSSLCMPLENFNLHRSNVSNPDLEKYRHQAEGINSDPFLPYN